MEAWIGLIGAIAGVIVAWGLGEATKIITARRKANRALKVAAFVCLDRLLKIKNAETSSDTKQRDHEIYLLGGDLDRYRDCIAASQKMRECYWSVYRKMMPILLKHDVSHLDEIITELETISGARDES
jgi:hypothetical protein